MKFHLSYDNKNAVCGCVSNRPDTFLYNEAGFTSHFATEYRCKKCEQTLKFIQNNRGAKKAINLQKILLILSLILIQGNGSFMFFDSDCGAALSARVRTVPAIQDYDLVYRFQYFV